jgi:hypothetical protein
MASLLKFLSCMRTTVLALHGMQRVGETIVARRAGERRQHTYATGPTGSTVLPTGVVHKRKSMGKNTHSVGLSNCIKNPLLIAGWLLHLLGGTRSFLSGKKPFPWAYHTKHYQNLIVAQRRGMKLGTDEEPEPQWCSKQKIYLHGVVPKAESAFNLTELLQSGDGDDNNLRIFGYGSLCWHPGKGVLSNERVRRSLGRAVGWRRCWAQRSADHRGTPTFPGLVCTLLKDKEVKQLKDRYYYPSNNPTTDPPYVEASESSSMTEGLIYTIPSDLVAECLEELVCKSRFSPIHGGMLS